MQDFSRVVYTVRTGSTNEDAAELLGDDAALGMTIVAEEQTHGAGRKGRTWIAQPGSSLLFTTILPREIRARDLWCVPFWTALAVQEALARCSVPADVHWPNDLLLRGRKLAGILCVSRITGDSARAGCGVGINVYRTADAQREIDPPPAFCDDAAHLDRNVLLTRILEGFSSHIALLDDAQAVARRWEAKAGLPGQRYRLQRDTDEHAFEATALSLESGGALLVERDDGSREAVTLADARALR